MWKQLSSHWEKKRHKFIKEIEGSDALKNELKEIKDKTALADFLKKHGCDVSVNEFAEHIRSQGEGEIGDDEAAAAAGGFDFFEWLFG